MKGLASYIAATAITCSLVVAPMAAQANTRAADSANYASESNNDDDEAGFLRLGAEATKRNQGWLLVLFGAAATAGAIAIILSSQSENSQKQSPSGANQSNGAT